MQRKLILLIAPLLVFPFSNSDQSRTVDKKETAQRFFQGIYGCDPSVVDNLAADSIAITYPIFERLFNTPVFRGKEAVRSFATGFCERWAEAEFTFHESIADGNSVVLLWSFSARYTGPASDHPSAPIPNQKQSWGGISIFHFDRSGKITAEIGEESQPGPFARMNSD